MCLNDYVRALNGRVEFPNNRPLEIGPSKIVIISFASAFLWMVSTISAHRSTWSFMLFGIVHSNITHWLSNVILFVSMLLQSVNWPFSCSIARGNTKRNVWKRRKQKNRLFIRNRKTNRSEPMAYHTLESFVSCYHAQRWDLIVIEWYDK